MNTRRFLKRILAVLLIPALLPLNVAAEMLTADQGLERVRKFNFAAAPKAFQSLRQLNLPMEKVTESLNKLSESKPAEMSAHVGKTLLFLLAVTGLDIVKTELKKSGAQKPSSTEIAAQMNLAAGHILNDAGIYLSLLGAGTADAMTKYPIRVFSAWIADPKARPVLTSSLRTMMGVLAATGGWDLGAQLKVEATYLLETPEEFQRIQSLFGTTAGALSALLLNSKTVQDQSDLLLLQKMGRNLLYVALFDQDLRSQWMDNTLRTRILTGEFAVLSAAIAAAGIGTMLLPGGGTVTGFIIGVAAVTIAINIPDEIKNSITKGLHSFRQTINQGRMRTRGIELTSYIRRWSYASWQKEDAKLERVQEDLAYRRQKRSQLLTVYIEQMRMVFREAFHAGDSPLLAEDARAQFVEIFANLAELFRSEGEFAGQLKRNVAESNCGPLLEMLNAEGVRVETLGSFFAQLGSELDQIFVSQPQGRIVFKDIDPRAQEFIKFVEVGYSRGFKEDSVL